MAEVMLIDDSRLVGMVIQRILSSQNIEMIHARTAAEVFGFRGMPPMLRENKVDLILLDIIMPDMDGLDILRKIKAMKDERNIPVLMISASASENNVVEAMNRGARGFISKPVDHDKLLQELARIAPETGSDALVHKLSAFIDPTRKAEESHEELIVGSADLNYLLEILDGDADMMYDLVSVFVTDMPAQLQAVEDAIGSGDPVRVRRSAHTFKGSVSNMGAPLITQKAFDLEKMGSSGKLDGAKPLFESMKTEADALYHSLKSWLDH
ncbi:MAG: response regulator [Acidobacteriota bacterium]|nr:response regulator [Acidobacteriota bacterium]